MPALGNGNRYPRLGECSRERSCHRSQPRGPGTLSARPYRDRDTHRSPMPRRATTRRRTAALAPVGSTNVPAGNGGLSSAERLREISLDIADRSALGLINLHLQNVTMQSAALRWNDNTVNATTQQRNTGAGAVVNYLPWEKIPTTPRRRRQHQPGLPGHRQVGNAHVPVRQWEWGVWQRAARRDHQPAGTPDPVQLQRGGSVASRNVYADPVQMQVRVPRYQPANLQLFDTAANAGPHRPEPHQYH